MQIDIHVLVKLALALGAAFLVSFITTPLVRTIAPKVGAMDVPNEVRRVHDHPIPRLGGIAIFLGFILGVVLFSSVDEQVRGILIGALVVVSVGVVDDIMPLPAWFKLGIQISAACIAVAFGMRIEIVSNPNIFSDVEFINLGFWSIPLTILWIVGITNSVNLIDGLDGLACGVSAIASITMLVIALVLGQWNIAVILAALVGACLGFIPYNLNPAKIFMGDTGALLLGYVLATVSVTGFFKFYAIISFAVPLLALGFPIFDTIFAVIRRLVKRQNPMMPDREHFHHRLIDLGFSQKQAVAILYSISAVLGLAAVLVATSGEMKAIMLVLSFCVAVAIGVAVMRNTAAARPQQDIEDKQNACEEEKETEPPSENGDAAGDGSSEDKD